MIKTMTEGSILFDRARDNRQTIYLAGAMSSVGKEFSRSWRRRATNVLQERYNILDPTIKEDEFAANTPVSRYLPEEIVNTDLAMIHQSDIVLAEISRTDIAYHGTSIEVVTAYRAGKAVYIWGGCVNPWIRYYSMQIFIDLDAALAHLLY